MRQRRKRRTTADLRSQVLQVAHELFYWRGIRSTGVDLIAARAQIAPTTLYRLFASKDELVKAYVEHNDTGYRDWLRTATAPEVGTPRERVLALFDALTEQTRPENCRGCPFLVALAEYPDRESPVHTSAVATKAWVRAHLRGLVDELASQTAQTPISDPAMLADQLALLVEGVYASVQALGQDGPARYARATAAALIDGRPAVPEQAVRNGTSP